MYKIYQTRIAPNARRLRIFLAEKGVADVEYVTVNLKEGENLSDDFRAKNPFGRIPVLEFEDGTCLSESVAISRYFEEIIPEPPLFGLDALDKAQVEMWNRRVDISFLVPSALAFRNISGFFSDREFCDANYGAEMKKPAAKALKLFDQRLQNSPYVAGERFTIADISLVAGFDFFNGTELVFEKDVIETLPGLKRWHGEISRRASYGA